MSIWRLWILAFVVLDFLSPAIAEETFRVSSVSPNTVNLSKQYNDLGCEAFSQGQDVKAEKLFVSAYNEALKVSDRKRMSTALSNLQSFYTARGRDDEAASVEQGRASMSLPNRIRLLPITWSSESSAGSAESDILENSTVVNSIDFSTSDARRTTQHVVTGLVPKFQFRSNSIQTHSGRSSSGPYSPSRTPAFSSIGAFNSSGAFNSRGAFGSSGTFNSGGSFNSGNSFNSSGTFNSGQSFSSAGTANSGGTMNSRGSFNSGGTFNSHR